MPRRLCPALLIVGWSTGLFVLQAERLRSGSVVEQALASGETHVHEVELHSGDFIHLDLSVKEFAGEVRVLAPDGSTAFNCRVQNGIPKNIPLSHIAVSDGIYRVQIAGVPSPANPTYKLTLQTLRPHQDRDERVIAAEKQLLRAYMTYAYETAGKRRESLAEFESALALWRGLEDARMECGVLTWIGIVHRVLGELPSAQAPLDEALRLARSGKLDHEEAAVLAELGLVTFQLGNRKQGLEHLERAAAIFRAENDIGAEADSLTRLGRLYTNSAEPEKALETYMRALELARQVRERKIEAYALNNLGIVFSNQPDYEKAIDHFQKSLAIWRELGIRDAQSSPLGNLGYAYQRMGDLGRAIEFHEQALAIDRESGDRMAEAYGWFNLGIAYGRRGEPQKSLDYLNRAREIWHDSGNRQMEAHATAAIGSFYLQTGDLSKALDHLERALPIRRDTGDQRGVAINLLGLGNAWHLAGSPAKASDYFRQSLSVSKEVGLRAEQAECLAAIALIEALSPDPAKAYEPARQALALAREVSAPTAETSALEALGTASLTRGDFQAAQANGSEMLSLARRTLNQRGEYKALYLLARIKAAAGDLESARKSLNEALHLTESVRGSLGSRGLRLSYQAETRETYDFLIDVLMRLHRRDPSGGFDAEALSASERARARVLLDVLAEAGVSPAPQASGELVERERNLKGLIETRTEQRIRLLSGPHSKARADGSEREIRTLLQEYEEVDALIRARDPRYAALSRPEPLSAAEIRQGLLSSETVLLEYALGKERSYLWALTTKGLTSFELPAQGRIDAVVQACYRQISRPEAEDPRVSLSAASRLLLNPVRDLLAGKRVVVVGDGSLQYVPFAALDDPAAPALPLAARHEVVSLPSASVLAFLRRDSPSRPKPDRLVAVIADPVFQADDSRVAVRQPQSATQSWPNRELQRSAGESGLVSLDRLRGSREEAEAIFALAPRGSALKALDFDASRSTVLGRDLARYRILHFATHGLLNSEHPELSGLVLSMVDRSGRPEPGFLQAHEIYGLQLSADLVVLSACQTAVGKNIRGEGLIGLTRGFMYAGVPRVVASLWQVSDRATAELMKHLYRGMIIERLPAGTALRKAQMAVRANPRWAAPYYWAGFVLQGDWN